MNYIPPVVNENAFLSCQFLFFVRRSKDYAEQGDDDTTNIGKCAYNGPQSIIMTMSWAS